MTMVKTVQMFNSFADAEHADEEYYASLSPVERLDLLLEMIARHQSSENETTQRFERVSRITELSQS